MNTPRRALAKKAAVTLVAAAVAGCAHERVRIETVPVKVPVPIPCAAPMPTPIERLTERPLTKATAEERLYEAMQNALAEIELWIGWEREARAAVKGCENLKGVKP